jgi:SEC-C motif-containing protein
MPVGRNELCPCGSGVKYKKCCLNATASRSTGKGLTPAQLVEARAKAFAGNDFAFIYDTFHPESNFRLQFPSCSEYIAYGMNTLTSDYQITQCRIIEERVDNDSAQVLFYLQVHYRGQYQEYFELSQFHTIDHCWRYLHSHKLARSDHAGTIDDITMEHVAAVGTYF